jgi:flagellar biosynthesis chaperone FliJ
MITKEKLIKYLKETTSKEFSKEELINKFSNSFDEENELNDLLSELELESTYYKNNLNVSCKAGTVYYRWIN